MSALILYLAPDASQVARAKTIASYRRDLRRRDTELRRLIGCEWTLARRALDAYRHAMAAGQHAGALTVTAIAQHHRANARHLTRLLRGQIAI